MFEVEKNGYKKNDVDYYIKRLEDDFQAIIKSNSEKLAYTKQNLKEITQTVPQYKSEIESLRERLSNLRDCANRASEARYLKDAQAEVLLANLIAKVLTESADLEKLKPVIAEEGEDDFLQILASTKELKLGDALEGFDFFDNNPYKTKAEKKLEKIKTKKEKRSR